MTDEGKDPERTNELKVQKEGEQIKRQVESEGGKREV